MTEEYGQWLDVAFVKKLIPYAEAAKVSEVARSERGFIPQYLPRGVGGLDRYWRNRRNGFVARHLAQVLRFEAHGDVPSRRLLALAMWAFGSKRNLSRIFRFTPAEYAKMVRVPSKKTNR